MSELENRCGSVVVSCYLENLVAEAEDCSGARRKEDVRRWKTQPSNNSEDMTVNNGVCVCVCVCVCVRVIVDCKM
jgi:hypothetical protein